MNDSNRIALMKIVERAVRPVRGSFDRKRRMREDLLAHVAAVFEEEVERLKNDASALESTAARFGDPKCIAQELQASVSAWNAWAAANDDIVMRPRKESILRRAARLALTMFIANTLASGIVLAIAAPFLLFRGMADRWWLGLLLLLKINAAVAVTIAAFTIIVSILRAAIRNPSRKSIRSAWVAAVLSTAIVPCVGVLLYGSFGLDFAPLMRYWLRTLPVGALTPAALYLFARATEREIAFRDEWEGLELE